MKTIQLKISVLFVFTCLIFTNLNAQEWLWALNAGAQDESDVGYSVHTDASGNSYVTGTFAGSITFGSYTLSSNSGSGDNDIFVAKFSSSGTCQWAVSAGGPGDDGANSISADISGNTYITGKFGATATFGTISGTTSITASGSGDDIFIAKFDPAGNCVWAENAGGSSFFPEWGYAITTDTFGNIYVTGTYIDNATFDTITLSSSGYDIFIAKYNNSGDIQWAKNANSGGGSGNGIISDISGNIYVIGNFTASATFGTNTFSSSGGNDIFIAKYDGTGNCSWAVKAGGTNGDFGNAITLDNNGNLYITGKFSGTLPIGSYSLIANGTSSDIFVAKYNSSNGANMWAQNSGGTGSDEGKAIAVDNLGYVYVTGLFEGTATFGTTPSIASTSTDIFVAMYDNTTCLWAGNPTGNSVEVSNSISSDASGNLYLTGLYTGPFSFGSHSVTYSGGVEEDIFITKLKVQSPPTVHNQLLSTVKCTGDMQTYTASATGLGTLAYQWKKDGVDISTATDSVLTLTSLALTDEGNYYCVVNNAFGADSTNIDTLRINDVTASFSINNSSQCLTGNNFTFVNSSTTNKGNIQSSNWDLGDMNSAITDTVHHNYQADATYVVKLTITSNYGCIDSTMNNIDVWPMPKAKFSINLNSQCLTGNDFVFTDSSTLSLGSLSYLWDFDDTNTSTSANNTHTYSTIGTYNVMLIANSNHSCSDTVTKSVHVREMPIAGFTIDDSIQCLGGNEFTFTSTSSIGSGMLSSSWDFGDQNTASIDSVNHVYGGNADTFDVTLLVTSNYGCEASITKTVYTLYTPSSEFTISDSTTSSFVMISYNGNADTANALFNWSFDSDGSIDSAFGQTYYVSWNTNGKKLISLEVTENGCTSLPSHGNVYVFKDIISISASKTTFCDGDSVLLLATANTHYTYQWKVNDTIIAGATSPYLYVYESGDYSVEITDITNNSYSETSKLKIEKFSSNFNLDFEADKTIVTLPDSIIITNKTPQKFLYNFTWFFGDGTIGSQADPSHTYLYNGVYSIKVIAQQIGSNCIDELTKTDYIECSGGTVNPCNYTAEITSGGTQVKCPNDTFTLQANVDTGFTYQWIHEGIIIPGATDTFFDAVESGEYRITIKRGNCSLTSDPFYISHYPTVVPVIESKGNIRPCSNDSMELYIDNYYEDYTWSTNQTFKNIWVFNSGNYTVTVTDVNQCKLTSEEYNVNKSLPMIPEICIVTVDTPTNYNYIVWERPTSTSIDSYYIYKETTAANIYAVIGSKGYDELSVFIDSFSNPAKNAERYRINLLDTCGNKSPLSKPHKTMHVTASKGTSGENNLIWSHYQGFPYASYYIYRGTTPANIQLIDSIQSNLRSYTDLTPPTGVVYYRVTIAKPNACFPANYRGVTSSGPYSQSLSNLKDYSNSPTPYMSIYPSFIAIDPDSGNTATFHVYSSLSTWNAVSDKTWLSIVNDPFTKTLTAIAGLNNSGNSRTGTITVSGTGIVDQSVTVFQNSTVGINESFEKGQLRIYPNPFTNTTNIVLPEYENYVRNLVVLDMRGKVVKSMDNIQGNRITLSCEGFEKGIYFVRLIAKDIYVDKIMVE